MALQTPQRLSTSSSHRSSTSSSSSSSSRKPRKLRPCPNNLTSPSPSTSLPGDDSAGKRSPSARIDVRFIPQDPAIAELVRLAGYCPKLELKTPVRQNSIPRKVDRSKGGVSREVEGVEVRVYVLISSSLCGVLNSRPSAWASSCST